MAYTNIKNENVLASTLSAEFTAGAKNDLMNFADVLLGLVSAQVKVKVAPVVKEEPPAPAPEAAAPQKNQGTPKAKGG